jgi:ribA/ribD-fused uncharacterized protein
MNMRGGNSLVPYVKVVDSFKGPYEKFSNFYPCKIYYEQLWYPTVEHAYVAAKSKDKFFRWKIAHMDAEDAGAAKKFGRKVILRSDWEMVKLSIMRSLLNQKFSNIEFKSLLLSTEDADIIEGNYWHDNYWGDCRCKKCKNIIGRNNLGKILMEIRNNKE